MKYFILALSLLCATMTTAQSSEFQSDLENFIQLTNDGKWIEVTDMLHPSMFQSFSKEQMAAMMGQMKAMGLNTKLQLKGITKVYDPIKGDTQTFQKFDYDVKVTIVMNEQLWSQKDFLMNGFKSSFGGKNLEIDEANKTILLDGEQSMIAIKDNGGEWKYMNFQNGNDPLAKSALPADVFEKISAQ